jgi:hypothetical protein
LEVKPRIVPDGEWSGLAEKPTLPTKCEPLSPCVRSCIENSIPLGNPHIQMVSTQELIDAEKATCDQCIRELTAQLDKEKAEAAAVVEAKAVAEAEVKHQKQEARRKAEAEAAAKQAESDAANRKEEANTKARVEIRKRKCKAEGPPAELSSARASGGVACTLCVAAGETCIPQPGCRARACVWCCQDEELVLDYQKGRWTGACSRLRYRDC